MNAATRGVILAVAAVILGVVVLGQGFGTDGPELLSTETDDAGAAGDDAAEPEPEPSTDDGSGDDGSDGSEEPADDGGEPAGDGGEDSGATAGDDDLTDPADPADDGGSTTPDIVHPPGEVRVLVANGTTVSGAAGRASTQLVNAQGFNGLTPTNTTEAVDATTVYYVPGYELDARSIAQEINASPEAVKPMPDAPPVDELLEAHVLVIVGQDFDGL